MSHSLSVASVIEKNRTSSEVPFLVCLDIAVINPVTGLLVETMYLVHNAEDIVLNGRTYYAAAFDMEITEEAGTQSAVTITIKDYTQAVQGRMEAYGGGVGFEVVISVVDGSVLDHPAEVSEYFLVVGASSANYVCTFTLGAENALGRRCPRRRQTRDFCQWRYKSKECGYSGPAQSCDYTLKGPNGCSTHSNTLRFGGFPGARGRDMRHV